MKRLSLALLLLCSPALFAQSPPISAVVLPVVGDVVGRDGTHFRTDVVVSNLRNQDQPVSIEWYPADVDSTTPRRVMMTLPGWTILPLHDFVPEVLHTTGLGAVRIVAVDAEGNRDSEGQIDAFARIWSALLNGEGTVSQSLYGLHDDRMAGGTGVPNMMLIGLRQDENFRTNLGIANLGAIPREFDVRVSGAESEDMFRVRVPADSMIQVPIPAGVFGDLALNVTPTENVGTLWTSYASTVDNRSADAWIAQDAHRRYHETPAP